MLTDAPMEEISYFMVTPAPESVSAFCRRCLGNAVMQSRAEESGSTPPAGPVCGGACVAGHIQIRVLAEVGDHLVEAGVPELAQKASAVSLENYFLKRLALCRISFTHRHP